MHPFLLAFSDVLWYTESVYNMGEKWRKQENIVQIYS